MDERDNASDTADEASIDNKGLDDALDTNDEISIDIEGLDDHSYLKFIDEKTQFNWQKACAD